jgi:hypothetical protein
MAALRAAALTAVFAYGVGSFEVGTEQLRFEVSNSSQVSRLLAPTLPPAAIWQGQQHSTQPTPHA